MAGAIEHRAAPSREVACQKVSVAAPAARADACSVDTGSVAAPARTRGVSRLHRHRLHRHDYAQQQLDV
eukprot:6118454-Pleurochrysis_carterae.AAC.1